MSKRKNDALALLTTYLDDEDDSDSEHEGTCDEVTKHSSEQNTEEDVTTKRPRKNSVESNGNENQSLPLPKGILNMFSETEEDESNPSSTNDGRIRSFAHFPGNWALHIYTTCSSALETVIDSIVNSLPSPAASSMHLFPLNDLHVSLSRTVPIRHYWIEPITEQLKEAFSLRQRFRCIIDKPQLYVNDEKTRSFLGLKILTGEKQLQGLTSVVDNVFNGFSLPNYYENPSFHVSIAWCLGDIFSQISKQDEENLQAAFDSAISDKSSKILSFEVNEVKCKIGNKLFSFSLSE